MPSLEERFAFQLLHWFSKLLVLLPHVSSIRTLHNMFQNSGPPGFVGVWRPTVVLSDCTFCGSLLSKTQRE